MARFGPPVSIYDFCEPVTGGTITLVLPRADGEEARN